MSKGRESQRRLPAFLLLFWAYASIRVSNGGMTLYRSE